MPQGQAHAELAPDGAWEGVGFVAGDLRGDVVGAGLEVCVDPGRDGMAR